MRDEDQAATRAPFYRPELDALRFLAFACVFVRHTTSTKLEWWDKLGLPRAMSTVGANVAQAGAFGVYLFYLLSAYLITQLLLREKAELGRVHLREFYVRRILRIWPLYFVYLAIACVYGGAVGEGVDAALLPFALLFLANWSGMSRGGVTPTAGHLWSISVEEQFYLVCPPLIAFTCRRSLSIVAAALIVLPVITIPLGGDGWDHVFMSSFSCFSAFGAGVLLANAGSLPRLPAWLAMLAGIACWYTAAALGVGASSGASIAGVLLIVMGSAAMLLAVSGWRPPSVLQYLGKISYGLYVFHVLVIAVADRFVDKKAIGLRWYPLIVLVELAVTIATASLSYRVLETPFLRMKERFALVKSRPV